MKNSPTVDMNRRAENLRIVVGIWMDAMFFAPERLTNAAAHNPARTRRIEAHLAWSLLMKCSTYSTQPTAIAAFPAQAVIQYDQAFMKPSGLPKPTRAYA
jgi:hypothetical protein